MMTDATNQQPNRPGWARAALAVILMFSSVLGTAAVVQFRSSPFFEAPIVDEESYLKWADEIVAGEGADRPFYQDPLYPYFLAAVFAVFGRSLLLVRLIQVGMGVAAVYLVYRTGRRLGGESLGLTAGALLALWGPLYFWELMLLKAALVILLSAAACALGADAGETPSGRARWAALGFILGLLCLLRGNFLLIAPALIAWAWAASRGLAPFRRALSPSLLTAGIALAIMPATIRNYIVSGEFVLTTSQGGPNFYIGNNDFADGTYVAPPFVYASPVFEAADFKAEAERRSGRRMRPGEVSRFWFREGLKWVRQHPGRAARLTARKTWALAHCHEVSDNQNYYFTREYFARALNVPAVSFGLLWGPALAGAAALRRRPGAWFPAVFAGAYALSLIPFFVVARYRVPLVPALALFAAAFFTWGLEAVRARKFRSLGFAGAVVVPALALAHWPAPFAVNKDAVSAFNLGNAFLKDGRPERAVEWYRRAFTLDPEGELYRAAWEAAVSALGPEHLGLLREEIARPDATAREAFAAGRRLEDLEKISDAVLGYERALEREPDFFPAHARLAQLLISGPTPDPARAERHLARALELFPDYGARPEAIETMMALGAYYETNNDRAAARRWYEEVLHFSPGHRGAGEGLERLLPG